MIHQSEGDILEKTNTLWNGASWPPQTQGKGFVLEGIIEDVNNHTVQYNKAYFNYVSILIRLEGARRRNYDDSGVEVEAAFIREKINTKNYLNKHEHAASYDPFETSVTELCNIIGSGQGALPSGYLDQKIKSLHPYENNMFMLWGDSKTTKPRDLKKGSKIRVKTKGDSIFVESIAKLGDAGKLVESANYAGQNVVGTWTDHIGNKKIEHKGPIPGENLQGVDDSEWN